MLRWLLAELSRDVAIPFTLDTIFSGSNRSLADEAWSSPEFLTDIGAVALSDDWVRSKDLPEAQRFPWDHSKGVYILNGFHNMHCLVGSVPLINISFAYKT